MNGDDDALRRAGASLVLAVAALAGLLVQLAPLDPLPAVWTPDLFWAALCLFAMRRPEAAPLPLIFALVVLRDALLGGPLGAGALTLMLGAEALRARARVAAAAQAPTRPWEDWVAGSLVYGATLAAQWLLLAVSFAPRPALADLAPGWIATTLALPVMSTLLRPLLRRETTAQSGAP